MATASELQNGAPGVEWIRAALDEGHLNGLRMALYQATRDPELLKMGVGKEALWGGTWYNRVVEPEFREQLKDKLVAFLASSPEAPAVPEPEQLRFMMEAFAGEPVSEGQFQIGLEELAFDDFPRGVEWAHEPAAAVKEQFQTVVIGAGLGGVAAAIQLQRLGLPYVVLDRYPDIGGTWLINDYPLARVDIASHHYQYSFEKNYPWKHYFATQAELKEYVEHCARKYDVYPHVRFNTELTAATWDEKSAMWQLDIVENGRARTIQANAVISAAGLFTSPKVPDIKGINQYKGKLFHTTAWDHNYDFGNKRAGLIGNGSTGVQLMPWLAENAKSLTVFQRTPAWILGVDGYRAPISDKVQWLFDNMPYYWNWYRFSLFYPIFDGAGELQIVDEEWKKSGGIVNKRNDELRRYMIQYIEEQLDYDEDLISRSIPDFAPWSKRPVVDNGWFQALKQPDVELVTSGINHFTPTGIVTSDGQEHELDVVVLGSGFQIGRYLWPVPYTGRGGLTIEQAWSQDGGRAYLGMTIPNFPNFFMLYGPNSQARAGGVITWLEIWARYAVKSIVKMVEGGYRTMDCRQDVFKKYNHELDQATKSLTWETEGKDFYYVNEFGRSAVNTPFTPYESHDWLKEPDLDDYELEN